MVAVPTPRGITPKAVLPTGTYVAAIASAAMIAQQVAGKAVRDALFLSSFRVQDLTYMIAASAVLTLAAAVWMPTLMMRYTPAKVVPMAFVVSGVALVGEWGIGFVFPRITAVLLYVHTALFGAVVISAFWSLINESFAPHSGRRAVAWVAGGGTAGGVLGGLVAWRAADRISLFSMLLVLAATNLVSVWGTRRLGAAPPEPRDSIENPAIEKEEPLEAPLRTVAGILLRTSYLRNLGFVVALGAVTSGLLDYVFSAVAVEHFSRDQPALLTFFAKFWLVVGILSFVLQSLFGRIALEKLGLVVSVAVLPAIVVLGGFFGIAVPGLGSMVVLRGGEAAQRNSVFRAAYELLYTPLSEQKKRASKMLIDVGCDRLGTVIAGLVAMVVVRVAAPHQAGLVLLGVAIACALISVTRSVPLHRGYVSVLEERLKSAAAELAPRVPQSVPPPLVALRDQIIEDAPESTSPRSTELDATIEACRKLHRGVDEEVRAILADELGPQLVAFAIPLLTRRGLRHDVRDALVRAAPRCTGQLVDALCDPAMPFAVRRRIPKVLARIPTLGSAEGLVRGLDDDRFEVRYECGRALLDVVAANREIVISLERIVGIVDRELSRDAKVWEADEDDLDDAPSLVDRLRRDRLDRSIEHIFDVLALHIDPESIRTAFRALHSTDETLRGTALEYLETVLPEQVRDRVWPFLGESRPMRTPRSTTEILADLGHSSSFDQKSA